MADLIDDKTKKELKRMLAPVQTSVNILYFTQENACPMCREQQKLLEDLVTTSDKLILKVYDFDKDSDQARKYRIDKIPATMVVSNKDYGIRFYGLTAGYEFSSLVGAILMIAEGQSHLSPELEKAINSIDEPIHIQVMVTLTCPYCPRAVHTAQQMALINDLIRVDMVDSAEFPQLAQRYDVSSVPKTVINEVHSFVGALPAEAVYLEILKATKPEEYRRLEEAMREAKGVRQVRKPDPEHEYDVIIVGAGPAAMSAAIYTARKELDVLLIAKEIGGQITYTTTVENYLGLIDIDGKEMVEQFRAQIERFPIAEGLGSSVVVVKKKGDRLIVQTEDGQQFTGNSLIYCAGKEYRLLGVPGEKRFIGRGIAFCATCDAPLYKDKKVAVVGGSNSAFTAVRDLVNFAQEIHLIHRRDTFKADPVLVKEAKQAKNVTFHTNMVVQEILGEDKLTGIRLQSTDGKERQDLLVDGVFIEIGLTPNTNPVKDFVKLNQRGEIPVARDNSTDIAGFFAAGDATDIPEKQIIIAAGEGAKAALSATKYLKEKKLIHKKIGTS